MYKKAFYYLLFLSFSILLITACQKSSSQNELRIGVAKTDITPAIGDTLISFGGDTTTVHLDDIIHPTYAKVAYFKQDTTEVFLLNFDVLSMSETLISELKDHLNKAINTKNIIISVTHSHSGYIIPNKKELLIAKVTKAVESAKKHHTEVTAFYAETQHHHSYNRRLVKNDGSVEMMWVNREEKKSGPIDQKIRTFFFKNLQGEVVLSWINTNIHPVVSMTFERLAITSDYPGVLEKEIEKKLGGMAIMSLGAAGEVNPFWANTEVEDGAKEQIEKLGSELTDLTVNAFENQMFKVPTDQFIYRSKKVTIQKRQDIKEEEFRYPMPWNSTLHFMSFSSQAACCFFPGEFFDDFQTSLINKSEFPVTVFYGYTDNPISYIPTIKAAKEGGYGASWGTYAEVGTGERLVEEMLQIMGDMN